MKKRLFIIAVAVLLIMPVFVFADSCADCPHGTEEYTEQWLENTISIKQNDNGKYVEIPAVAFPNTSFGYNAKDLAHALARYIFEGKDDAIEVLDLDLDNNTITILVRYMKSTGVTLPKVGDIGNNDPVIIDPSYVFSTLTRTYPFVLTTEYDNDKLDGANEVLSQIESSYSISDMATINLSWNYGVADVVSSYYRNSNRIVNDSQLLLYSYQELKNILTSNPDYEYDIKVVGDYSSLVQSGVQLELIIKKDGIVYASKVIDLSTDYYFFVDKNGAGSVEDRVKARLKSYLGDDVDFYLKPYVSYETYMDDNTQIPLSGFYLYFGKDSDAIHQYYEGFCNHDADYCIDSPFVTIPNVNNPVGDMMSRPYYYLLVAEVDGSKIKDLEVSATDASTGVEIETGSYEVPLDTLINSEDLKHAQNIISVLNKYNYNMVDAYNIEIYGYGNGNKIKEISNGVVVFIPIKGYKEGDVITIRHITDDNELGETYQGTVVKKNGKLYAKFTTTHFSTYAIVEDATTNPDTGDNIFGYVSMLIISVIGTGTITYYLRKKRDV